MQHMSEVPDGFACLCVVDLNNIILSISDNWPATVVGMNVLLLLGLSN